MSPMDTENLFHDEVSGTDGDGVRHWQRMDVTEWWEGIDTAGRVCTTAASREAVVESHTRAYEFLMQQTEKYNIDWYEHGGDGPPLPLAGVRRVVRREVNSGWEERGRLMDERGSYGFQPCEGCTRTPDECARVCPVMPSEEPA